MINLASRWIPVPIDLGPASDEVYLVLFGSGFRAATGITNISARLGRRRFQYFTLGLMQIMSDSTR
jgi:hypothetical protein